MGSLVCVCVLIATLSSPLRLISYTQCLSAGEPDQHLGRKPPVACRGNRQHRAPPHRGLRWGSAVLAGDQAPERIPIHQVGPWSGWLFFQPSQASIGRACGMCFFLSLSNSVGIDAPVATDVGVAYVCLHYASVFWISIESESDKEQRKKMAFATSFHAQKMRLIQTMCCVSRQVLNAHILCFLGCICLLTRYLMIDNQIGNPGRLHQPLHIATRVPCHFVCIPPYRHRVWSPPACLGQCSPQRAQDRSVQDIGRVLDQGHSGCKRQAGRRQDLWPKDRSGMGWAVS